MLWGGRRNGDKTGGEGGFAACAWRSGTNTVRVGDSRVSRPRKERRFGAGRVLLFPLAARAEITVVARVVSSRLGCTFLSSRERTRSLPCLLLETLSAPAVEQGRFRRYTIPIGRAALPGVPSDRQRRRFTASAAQGPVSTFVVSGTRRESRAARLAGDSRASSRGRDELCAKSISRDATAEAHHHRYYYCCCCTVQTPATPRSAQD
ncbi:unnamed protein product [Lampetra planeri]